jgi:Protein of unknown function (DUF2628)
MATTYTLHVPASAEPGDAEALEKAELVRDGFSWGAFLFTFLWFFWHRLWLAGIAVLIAVVGLPLALRALGFGGFSAFAAEVLLSILIGLEANSLKRWTWSRRKPAVDVVTASDRDEAEAKAFARWLDNPGERRTARALGAAPFASYRGSEPVIGLFPDVERPR